jgi:hypothetical protein
MEIGSINMGISVRYILICGKVTIDKKEDMFSCHDIFDKLEVNTLPTQLNKSIYLIVGFDNIKVGKKEKFTIEVKKPSGSYFFNKRDLVLEGKGGISPDIYLLELKKLPITESGVYSFEVFHNKEKLSEHPLQIIKEVLSIEHSNL